MPSDPKGTRPPSESPSASLTRMSLCVRPEFGSRPSRGLPAIHSSRCSRVACSTSTSSRTSPTRLPADIHHAEHRFVGGTDQQALSPHDAHRPRRRAAHRVRWIPSSRTCGRDGPRDLGQRLSDLAARQRVKNPTVSRAHPVRWAPPRADPLPGRTSSRPSKRPTPPIGRSVPWRVNLVSPDVPAVEGPFGEPLKSLGRTRRDGPRERSRGPAISPNSPGPSPVRSGPDLQLAHRQRRSSASNTTGRRQRRWSRPALGRHRRRSRIRCPGRHQRIRRSTTGSAPTVQTGASPVAFSSAASQAAKGRDRGQNGPQSPAGRSTSSCWSSRFCFPCGGYSRDRLDTPHNGPTKFQGLQQRRFPFSHRLPMTKRTPLTCFPAGSAPRFRPGSAPASAHSFRHRGHPHRPPRCPPSRTARGARTVPRARPGHNRPARRPALPQHRPGRHERAGSWTWPSRSRTRSSSTSRPQPAASSRPATTASR